MKDIVKVFGVICCIIFFSCINHSEKRIKDDFKLQQNFEYVHLIPDSLRTPKQQKLFDLIFETVVCNLKVEENHLMFGLSEVDFLKRGVPKPYYDLLQHNLKSANQHFEKEGIENVDSILNESYKKFYIRFKKK